MGDNKEQLARLQRYSDLIQRQAGAAVRPYRADGYVNLMNKYGTSKDTSENYEFVRDMIIPDEQLTILYEENGLFAKIIDVPAEESIKHGFELQNIADQKIVDFYTEALDELDWEQTAEQCIKWSRLFGGAIAVLLVNDGRGIDEPLDWKNIQSIDDIRVYERAVVEPDYTSMFSYDPTDPFRTRGSRLGMPEYYYVHSKYGNFTVHESRCLTFQNGVLPENASNSIYQFWGVPEYVRLKRALRDAELSHGSATKMLDKSVQPVYKMKDLSNELATEEGEDRVLRRMQIIDTARGMLNTLVIDNEGEDYDFRTFQFAGVSSVVDAACNYLSALTSIPQTILFGRSPAGMNATGQSDFENYYNFVQRIQKRQLKSNLRYLLSVIFQAGLATHEIDEIPKINIKFDPLWSLSEAEETQLELQKAQIQQTRAATAQIYVGMQALDPTEIRKNLAKDEEFDVENIITEDDISEDDLMSAYEQTMEQGGEAPDAAPEATKLPQDMQEGAQMNVEQEAPDGGVESEEEAGQNDSEDYDKFVQERIYRGDGDKEDFGSVGVIVVKDGKILCGERYNEKERGQICGPGGHIENGESAEEAAIRETQEEFGITPVGMIQIGYGPEESTGLKPVLFLCTEFEGEPKCDEVEMIDPDFLSLKQICKIDKKYLFEPFFSGIQVLNNVISESSSKNVDIGDEDGIINAGFDGNGSFNEEDHPRDESGKFSDSGKGVGKKEKHPHPKHPAAEKSKEEARKKAEAEKKAAEARAEKIRTNPETPDEIAEANQGKRSVRSGTNQGGIDIYPDGWNIPTKGFAPGLLGQHIRFHGKEPAFSGMSEEEYEENVRQLLRKPVGGDILGYATVEHLPDGDLIAIVRFDKKRGIYAKGYPGGNIKTGMQAKYFKDTRNPSVGIYPDSQKRGLDYYYKLKKREAIR